MHTSATTCKRAFSHALADTLRSNHLGLHALQKSIHFCDPILLPKNAPLDAATVYATLNSMALVFPIITLDLSPSTYALEMAPRGIPLQLRPSGTLGLPKF